MKDVSNVLETHLNNEKHFMSCDLYDIRLKSGVSYYYADTDKDVAYGGKVYRVDGPIITRTQIKTSSKVSVDKLTLTIHSAPNDTIGGVPIMTVAHNGGFDGATVRLIRVFFDGTGTVIGGLNLFQGEAEVKSGGGLTVQLEIKSVVQKLNTEWPNRRYYPQCPYTLYDGECGVNIKDYRKRAVVTQVPDHNTVVLNINHDNGFYTAGGIEWVSGALVGQTTQVMKDDGSRIYFITPSEAQPSVGDEAYIYPGCDKTPATCKAKFNNFSRNRATPYVPLKETVR